MLKTRPDVTIVSVCHHDTPSGTLNPIDEIGALVAEHGAYLIVDAVSSFGGMDIHPDDCQADIFVTGPNKCLGCPPGLSLLGVSDRAWAKMKANPDAPRASMLTHPRLGERLVDRTSRFPFTPSVAEINGLDAALDLYLDEGPEAVWARHALTAKACRAGVKAMGLEIWAGARGDRLADDDRGAHARRHRRGDAARDRRATRYGVVLLLRTRRDARQADAHRPHGADGAADLRRRRACGARRRAERLGRKTDIGAGRRRRAWPSSTPTH